MSNTKKSFDNLINQINELNISKKAKNELINNVLELILSFQDEISVSKNEINKRLNNIEKKIQNDDDIFDREYVINCPYCNETVDVFMSKDKLDIRCPYCKNIIQVEIENNINKM